MKIELQYARVRTPFGPNRLAWTILAYPRLVTGLFSIDFAWVNGRRVW